jgi:hypothetical protein
VLLREFMEGAEVKREGEELMATRAARLLIVLEGLRGEDSIAKLCRKERRR